MRPKFNHVALELLFTGKGPEKTSKLDQKISKWVIAGLSSVNRGLSGTWLNFGCSKYLRTFSEKNELSVP